MPLLQTRPNKHVSADAPPSRTVTQQPTRSQMLRLFHHSALHLFLFQPLIALLLHGGTPRFLLEPLLQDFLLALPQLLLIVAPGPLLPLQPVLLPRDCRESRWGRGVLIDKSVTFIFLGFRDDSWTASRESLVHIPSNFCCSSRRSLAAFSRSSMLLPFDAGKPKHYF